MNIGMIRMQLFNLMHKPFSFYYNGLRGQNELFQGSIIQVFPRVFLIETNNHVIKCFSYSDFATKTLKVCDKRK